MPANQNSQSYQNARMITGSTIDGVMLASVAYGGYQSLRSIASKTNNALYALKNMRFSRSNMGRLDFLQTNKAYCGFDVEKIIKNIKIHSKSYEKAYLGGRHSGQLKTFMKQSPKQLQKSIYSFEKQIYKHKNWINNPKSKMDNWDKLTTKHQQNLINHWKKDIQRAEDFKEIAETL